MQVENVSRIGLAPRRPAQQERNLAVCPRLLGEIVINNECIFTEITEVFAHGATRIGRDVLHCRGLGRARGHHDGMVHGAVLFQLPHHAGYGRGLLSNSDVDAGDARALLVDDGVDGERRLTRLPIADDELTLAAADGNHGVDGFQPRLHGLADRLAGDNAGRHLLDRRGPLGLDGTLAIHRLTE